MTNVRAIFISMLLVPLIPLASFFTLGGVSADPKHQRPTLEALYSGAYQSWFEAHFSRHYGAFRPLVKVDAAIDSLLGESKFNGGSCGLRGEDDVLFQNDEIDFLNQVTFDDQAIAKKIDALVRAKAALAKFGVPLKVFFIPTKLEYFPNHLPSKWRIPRPGSPDASKRVVEAALAELKRRGVEPIDVRKLVQRVITWTNRPAFPNGGRHFTDFTTCQMLGQLQPTPVQCPPGDERPVRGAEDDLRRCLNETTWRAPERVIDTSLSQLKSPFKRVLFVGSSFMRELENEARRLQTFEDLHLFYYNQNDYVGELMRPLPEGAAWRDFVRTRDLIVIDFFGPQVERIGHEFPERVVAEFENEGSRQ